MSNCISIVSPEELTFNASKLNIEKFLALMKRAELKINNDNCCKYGDGLDNERAAWWFLSTNYKITEDNRYVKIRLGCGRSTHTMRDFKWTMEILYTFTYNKGIGLRLYIKDLDYDDGRVLFSMDFPADFN